jgi:hypothetical protein
VLTAGAFLTIWFCLLSGCGYTTSTLLPKHIQTVAIPVFGNETVEYGLEQELTEAVLETFVADGHLKVVAEKDADSVILGRIVEYENQVFGYDSKEQAQEYQVVIRIAVVFKDQVKNKIRWEESSMVETSRYFVKAIAGQDPTTEEDGRKKAVSALADNILTRTVQGW